MPTYPHSGAEAKTRPPSLIAKSGEFPASIDKSAFFYFFSHAVKRFSLKRQARALASPTSRQTDRAPCS